MVVIEECDFLVTIEELINITRLRVNVSNTIVFNFSSDGTGVVPDSYYNVTIEPVYCGGELIGNASSTIISTAMSESLRDILFYYVYHLISL